MKILTPTSLTKLESLLVEARRTRTDCLREKNPNNLVLLLSCQILAVNVLHIIFAQLIHTCLQRDIGSCRDSNFRDD